MRGATVTARVEIVAERCQVPGLASRVSGAPVGCGHVSRVERAGLAATATDGPGACSKCGCPSLVVVEVHHAKCADPLRLGCQCPASWPRRLGEENVKHVKGGNCWAGVRGGDVCPLHDEPRGECSVCARCPACDLVPL